MSLLLPPRPFATAVLIIAPEGIPLMRELSKPSPIFWKLTGGHGEPRETASHCAARETWEEMGLHIDATALELICSVDKGDHDQLFFQVTLPSLAGLEKQRIDRGDPTNVIETAIFSPQGIIDAQREILTTHYMRIVRLLTRLAATT